MSAPTTCDVFGSILLSTWSPSLPLGSYVMHSQYALQLVNGMCIGRLQDEAGDEEMTVVGANQLRRHLGQPLPSAPPLSDISGRLCLPVDFSLENPCL